MIFYKFCYYFEVNIVAEHVNAKNMAIIVIF